MQSVNVHQQNGTVAPAQLSSRPNSCPFCHYTQLVKNHFGYDVSTGTNPVFGKIEVIFQCTNVNCRKIFIGYYEISLLNGKPQYYNLIRVMTGNPVNKQIPEAITEISPLFTEIYNQAFIAESHGLTHICGIGYRKAIEFLIKDYLIHRSPGDADLHEKIKSKMLGSCISEYVPEPIKQVAKHAAWLGNDETHYVRKWPDKDISDLKILIDLTLHWIQMEKLTEQYAKEMG